jgi:DHA2 family multidrug resistance protein
MYTNLTLSTSFAYVILPNVLLGIGVISIFVPISSIALGTLPKSELSNGAGLHSLAKCVMTSFTVSISTALVTRLSQIHQNFLVGDLSPLKNAYRYKLAKISHKMAVHAPNIIATTKAKGILYKQMLVQAKIMSFSNVFALFALIAFVLAPFAFLLTVTNKRPES